MTAATADLVAICNSIDYDDLPESTVQTTKKLVLDTLACSVGGFGAAPCDIVREYVSERGGAEATILGETDTVSLEGAALVNCTYARYLDLNDVYWSKAGDAGHPSGNIPLALAVAEHEGSTGRELIEAIVAGYEAQLRLYEAPRVSTFTDVGWDHTSAAHISTPITAGKLMGLDDEELLNAVGISGSYVVLGELRVGNISMIKAPAFGFAAERGVEAAKLARAGFTGPTKIIEGNRGYLEMLAGGGNELLFSEPADEYLLDGVCIKQYPAAYVMNTPIQTTLELVREHDIEPETVERVHVETFEWLLEDMVEGMGDTPRTHPENKETADHSLPYVTAVAILDRDVGLDQFTPERISSTDVRAMMDRIDFEHREDFEQYWPESYPVTVTVETVDGETYEHHRKYATGDPRDPLSFEQIEEKFASLGDATYSPDRRDRIADTVRDLENLRNVSDLLEQFVVDRLDIPERPRVGTLRLEHCRVVEPKLGEQ
jgi:2-methylcitrate dehydratase